jgi:predicted amino acid racemase
MASEIEEVVKYVDISFNSEMSTLEILNEEAAKQGKVHKAVLMIDVGDLREGIFFQNDEEIIETAKKINDMENVELYGVGVNLTCYGAIIPKNDNLSIICDFAAKIEEATGAKLTMISGGNSSSIYLVGKGELPEKINNLRLGEAFLLGNDTAYGERLAGTVDDALVVEEGMDVTVNGEGYLSLTQVGKDVAEKIYQRHTMLTDMLVRLGVSREVAAEDACKIEHVISEETVAAIKNYIENCE